LLVLVLQNENFSLSLPELVSQTQSFGGTRHPKVSIRFGLLHQSSAGVGKLLA